MPYDVDAADDWLGRWAAGISAQAERTAALSRRLAALTASAQSADGTIKVTVGSSGRLESLELADRGLAGRVLAVLRRGQASLADQAAVAVRETVGAESAAGRAVLHSFETRFPRPDPGDEDAADDR